MLLARAGKGKPGVREAASGGGGEVRLRRDQERGWLGPVRCAVVRSWVLLHEKPPEDFKQETNMAGFAFLRPSVHWLGHLQLL